MCVKFLALTLLAAMAASCSSQQPVRTVANVEEVSAVKSDEEVLTDEQAEELGMVEVGSPAHQAFQHMALEADPNFTVQGYLDSLANERALTSAEEALKIAPRVPKLVLVVNKAQKGEAKSAQTLKVFKRVKSADGVYSFELLKTLKVSTGTEKEKKTTSGRIYIASTPDGFYRPQSAYQFYESNTFVGANMDFAVFFEGGNAFHSTTPANYKDLGSRASGGCVRLKREEAEWVNAQVLETGKPSNYVLQDQSMSASDGSGRKVKRVRYTQGNIEVFGLYRSNGVLYNEDTVDLWNTVVVIKNFKD